MTGAGDLHDQVVVVTGAAEALGAACVEHLAARGATVVTGGVREAAAGGCRRADAVVVVAPTPTGDLLDAGPVVGEVVRAATAGLDVLRAQGGGRLVLVASGPAFPLPGAPALAIVDGAILGLVRSLGAEAEGGPVLVNGVAPLVDGVGTTAFFDAHPYLDRSRFGAEAVASLVAFLAHERCRLRGEVLTVGGGRVARVATVTAAGVVTRDTGIDALAAAMGPIRSLDGCIEPRDVLDEILLVDV